MARFILAVEESGPRRFHLYQLLQRHRSNEQQSLHCHMNILFPDCVSQTRTWQPYKASPSFYEHFLWCWSLNTSWMARLWHLMRFKACLGSLLIDYSCLSCIYKISCLEDIITWPSFIQLYSRMVAYFSDGGWIIKSAGCLWLCRSHHVSLLIRICGYRAVRTAVVT